MRPDLWFRMIDNRVSCLWEPWPTKSFRSARCHLLLWLRGDKTAVSTSCERSRIHLKLPPMCTWSDVHVPIIIESGKNKVRYKTAKNGNLRRTKIRTHRAVVYISQSCTKWKYVLDNNNFQVEYPRWSTREIVCQVHPPGTHLRPCNDFELLDSDCDARNKARPGWSQ
jgi:hypothetical protein